MNIIYQAMPAQLRFLKSQAQFAGLFGGIGSGKSHVGCFWALMKALRNPQCLGLIGANSYRQLKDATLRTFESLLVEHGIGYKFLKSSDMVFRLDNGAEVLCRSMDNFDLLRGIELGWFYLDELRDTRHEAWQVVKGRLRSQAADRLEGRVTSSPNGFDWIYEEFLQRPSDPATAAAYANHEAIFARTCDNRHLPPDYIAALSASYDPLLAEQELDGRFINVTQGGIYYAFDRAVHVTEAARFDTGRPVLWSLDFNVNPMTAIIAQADADGIRVVDELWLPHSNTLAMCAAFREWGLQRGVDAEGVEVYGDASGASRSTAGTSDYAIIRETFPSATLRVGASNPARRDRYNAVNAALKNAHGDVRLLVHPRCRQLVADLERVTYLPGTNLPNTQDPLRGHISDALGYLVARRMPAGRAALGVGRW